MYFYPQPPVFESEVAQRLSTPGVAVGEFVVSICDSSIPCTKVLNSQSFKRKISRILFENIEFTHGFL